MLTGVKYCTYFEALCSLRFPMRKMGNYTAEMSSIVCRPLNTSEGETDYIVVDDGDTLLTPAGQFNIRVSSTVLSYASPVFKVMLGDKFKEGRLREPPLGTRKVFCCLTTTRRRCSISANCFISVPLTPVRPSVHHTRTQLKAFETLRSLSTNIIALKRSVFQSKRCSTALQIVVFGTNFLWSPCQTWLWRRSQARHIFHALHASMIIAHSGAFSTLLERHSGHSIPAAALRE